MAGSFTAYAVAAGACCVLAGVQGASAAAPAGGGSTALPGHAVRDAGGAQAAARGLQSAAPGERMRAAC